MNITAFTDCASETIVIRIPYDLAVNMLLAMPEGKDKDDLKEKVWRASSRSNKLRKLLEDSCVLKG